ncbi:MAG: hypothetical protein M1290_00100 [Candidatus Thermoplasmatota archaeon]|jgi:hypothetical protein|nr:hypothetical protein [Candidatus Thermoplasmatota archaeon]MCL5788854.1 hypothetical protein [Candidatus Thermoplasmatota archaeon]
MAKDREILIKNETTMIKDGVACGQRYKDDTLRHAESEPLYRGDDEYRIRFKEYDRKTLTQW